MKNGATNLLFNSFDPDRNNLPFNTAAMIRRENRWFVNQFNRQCLAFNIRAELFNSVSERTSGVKSDTNAIFVSQSLFFPRFLDKMNEVAGQAFGLQFGRALRAEHNHHRP